MTKELFKENLLDGLKTRGVTAKITFRNGCEKVEMSTAYHGIVAFAGLSPMFDAYKEGASLDAIIEHLEDQLNETPSDIVELRTAIESGCMEKLEVYPALRSVSKKTRLPDVPFTVIGDTDLVLGWKLRLKENPQGTAWLTAGLRKYLHITQVDFQEAIKNLIGRAELLNVTGQPGMLDLVNEDLYKPLKNPRNDLMFALTCDARVEGAALLAFPEVREQILKNYPGYRIILPSSVHEVLLVHESFAVTEDDVDYCKWRVEFINDEMVSGQDFLSNNIYYIEDDGSLKML